MYFARVMNSPKDDGLVPGVMEAHKSSPLRIDNGIVPIILNTLVHKNTTEGTQYVYFPNFSL